MYKGFTRILSLHCADKIQPCVPPIIRNNVITRKGGHNIGYIFLRTKRHDRGPSALFVPVPVKPNPDDINIGAEITGRLKKQDLLKILNKFYQKPEVRVLASENGLDEQLLHQAFLSFRRHCLEHDLPPDLHIIISDIIQGEERRHASLYTSLTGTDEKNIEVPDDHNLQLNATELTASNHVACTVEMTSLNNRYEVAIIDEIQMIGDRGRGWAWTRAILGLQADEIHLCGEAGAIGLIEEICNTTGEELEVRTYKRLTELKVEDTALGSLDNVKPGDCIVCFNKNDIYSVSRAIEQRGQEVAVIYGSLPPGTKLAQANKFNDPNSSCKVMVATDAIGLGINLSIRRIIFYSLIKPVVNEDGDKEMDVISISQALQIAGRAGRYGSAWETGYVTTYKPEDLATLKKLLANSPDPVTQAGLHPTAEQMELYAYHLPHASLSSLMNWMCNAVDWPLPAPKTIMDLVHLESVFDVLELYLWLRLLRNSEQVLRDDPQIQALNNKRAIRVGSSHTRPKGEESKPKLSDMLVAKGLITPQMLKKLQQELATDKKPERSKNNRNRRK
ncbi:hypothetical protein HF086_017114 [Spodoptera exigua]|uniref:Helicase C-terminal domain-containing protein n=1 Tax=Spodoptera exigua TaxID=7107 RepID=A0A922MQA9_SPOEX|nr:hypothetical protein HF086_017114 [Spodoptera exigua]